METAVKWAQLYAAACVEVSGATDACLAVANRAVGARSKIAQHQNDGLPGTPIAIRNFTTWAEKAEQEFAPLYRAFVEACTTARDTAAKFLGAQTAHDPELVLILNTSEDVADKLATVKAILSANYGATPSGFLNGVAETNQVLQNPPDDGNIYTPPPPTQPESTATGGLSRRSGRVGCWRAGWRVSARVLGP